jgi:SAM-dependent methyltransferase
MNKLLSKLLKLDENESQRNIWLSEKISSLSPGLRLLDAGAGELRNKPLCNHLIYISQDICQYEGKGDGYGLQTGSWCTDQINIICDITNIPEPDESFDVILCSEVFEHIPDPLLAVDEFARLLKPGGLLILTAPFASLVHFAPYHYLSGFSKYWFEYHLPRKGFEIIELQPNGDWFSYLKQELARLPYMSRRYRDNLWPMSYLFSVMPLIYFLLRRNDSAATDVACFGWHCLARKRAYQG